MAETQSTGEQPVFQIQRVYLKDLSLEQPNSPQILLNAQQPEVDINLSLAAEPVTEGVFEVSVTATVTTKVGDKTLLDALVPAIDAFDAAIGAGEPFDSALGKLVVAAEDGRDSTLNLVAKIGRSARLGDRSLGVLDAGATSCAIILKQLCQSVQERLL
jgi:hypothetical protein